jgi:hypothetical protein
MQFGGKMVALDVKNRVPVDANVFGTATVRAVDEAKFARFLNEAGSEEAATTALKMLIFREASELMGKRTRDLGTMEAIGPDFAQALMASSAPAFREHGAELVIGELNVNLSEKTIEALKVPVQSEPHPAPATSSKSPMATVGAIALVVVAAIGSYVVKSLKSGGPKPTMHTGWDGTRPYRCNGHDDVVFGGFTVDLPNQTAISASEHCRLKLDGVKLTAATAIEASGNAVVVVNGGSIEGTTAAVHVSGNAHVIFKGTAVKGQAISTGNGSITGP